MNKETFKFTELGFPSEDMYRFPNIINLGVYRGDCPCNCVHCPVGITKPTKRKSRFHYDEMDMDLFEKIAEEASSYPTTTIRLHSIGEPLYWTSLPEAMKLTRGKGVRTWLFTSAVTSDTDLLDVIARNIDIIEVSVNSSNSYDYKKTKGIDAFDIVRKNIRYVSAIARRAQRPNRLIVSRVQTKDLEMDQQFVDFWKGTGEVDDAFVRSYHTYNELMGEVPDFGFLQHYPCLVHWGRMNVDTNGDVVVCFNELFKDQMKESLILGNLRDQTIVDVWHGDKLNAIRMAELSGDYSKAPVIPCKNCRSCQPLQGKKQTSEHQVTMLPINGDKHR